MNENTTLVECDHCGKIKECSWAQDPYCRELADSDEEKDNAKYSYWCRDCYESRHDDV